MSTSTFSKTSRIQKPCDICDARSLAKLASLLPEPEEEKEEEQRQSAAGCVIGSEETAPDGTVASPLKNA